MADEKKFEEAVIFNKDITVKESATFKKDVLIEEKLEVKKTINVEGKIQENGIDLVPKGTIVMWYNKDKKHPPPDGWKICNGENSTPDLRGRFIVGTFKDNKVFANDKGGIFSKNSSNEEFGFGVATCENSLIKVNTAYYVLHYIMKT